VFYFTIAFAFHQYGLLSQVAAFVIMVVITAFAIAMALLYDKKELAVIAAVGGFLTPFLVSTGQGNYVVLFSYLLILNAGLLALAYFKRWPLLNVLSLFFTELIFGGWLIGTLAEKTPGVSYPVALAFATAFYLLFLSMNMIYQVKQKQSFKVFDFFILLLLNASYFGAGMALTNEINGGRYQGIFTLATGILNFVLARYFFRREGTDRNLVYLLIGLTLTFLSLTIPIQLNGHAVTLFWSAEFVLLFWLYQRSRVNLFYYSSLLVAALALSSLFLDWAGTAFTASSSLVLIYKNAPGLVTNIVAAIAFGTYAYLVRKESTDLPRPVGKKPLYIITLVTATGIAFLTAIYGVNLSFQRLPNYEVPNVYHRLITQLMIILLSAWLFRIRGYKYNWMQVGAVSAYLLYHIASFSLITGLRDGVLTGIYSSVHLVLHWVSLVGALYLIHSTAHAIRKGPVPVISTAALSWILSFLAVVFISQEAQHLFITAVYNGRNVPYLEAQYAKAVLTIVWALCSFALMWLGMRYKDKTLRIISLSLFSLALLKLFFSDIVNVSEGGKILAFILLGVLLLTISFMYQRLKKIIIDNESK
jgi:uncharacterized membrane protein